LASILKVEQMQKSLDDIKTRKETEEAAAMEIRASLEDATKDLRASLEEAQTELAENERAIASLKTKQDGIMTSQNLVKERSLHVESTISACQEKLLGLQSKFQSLQQQYGEEQKSFDALKYDLDAMNTEIISMINDEAAMKDKYTHTIHSISTILFMYLLRISSMLSSLEETKALYSHQQSQSSRNGVVARLLNASKPGGPLQSIGIRGRLGDLGSIAPEYDIAVRYEI
jgi:chromosome segregation ATPase